jgi:hypothetical protein
VAQVSLLRPGFLLESGFRPRHPGLKSETWATHLVSLPHRFHLLRLAVGLVDSNVLLDIMTEDPRWFSWSAKALATAAETFRLVINPIIYAEVSIRYSRIEDLTDALPPTLVVREAIPYEAAFPRREGFSRLQET